MLEVNTQQDKQKTIVLHSAILLYGSTEGNSNARYATIHSVDTTKRQPVINAGAPIERKSLLNAIRSLQQSTIDDVFVSENVIAISPGSIMWWHPAKRHRLWFKTREFNEVREEGDEQEISGEVPLPSLVFCATERALYVFAVKGNERPSRSTKLFRTPFFNVDSGNEVCMGNVKFPDAHNSASIPAWEKAFFRSRFTHTVDKEIVEYQGGFAPFWKDLFGNKWQTFPEEVLLPTHLNIERFVHEHF